MEVNIDRSAVRYTALAIRADAPNRKGGGTHLVVLAFGNNAVVGDFVWSFHWEGGCQ
jgi:hypothetical protein